MMWKERFITELLEWQGTEYKHMGNCKGRAADCTLFIAQCLVNIGLLKKIEHDYYPKDWHMHGNNEFLRSEFLKHLNFTVPGITTRVTFENIDYNNILPCDLLFFSLLPTRITHHFGVLINNNRFIHCMPRGGVRISNFGHQWRTRLTGFVRIDYVRD